MRGLSRLTWAMSQFAACAAQFARAVTHSGECAAQFMRCMTQSVRTASRFAWGVSRFVTGLSQFAGEEAHRIWASRAGAFAVSQTLALPAPKAWALTA
jgi:hypothetical protein